MEVNGFAAIVTGGASGLRAAAAEMLARNGAKVAIFDRNQTVGEVQITKIGGLFVAADVTDDESIDAAIQAAPSAHGAARILGNCACVGPAIKAVGKAEGMAASVAKRLRYGPFDTPAVRSGEELT